MPIPGSHLYAQVFPTRWRVFSSSHQLIDEGDLFVSGPLKRFCVFQNLHRGGLAVVSEKYKYYLLPSGQCVSSLRGSLPPVRNTEPLLSLGVYKHADLHKMRHRRDIREILPFWFRLAVMTPAGEGVHVGSASLLTDLDQKVQERRKVELCSALLCFYLAGMSENLLPRVYDDEYQGLLASPDHIVREEIPFSLLHKSASVLQSIFIDVRKEEIGVLPALPPELPCGRFLNIPLPGIGRVSLEWSKKVIRRVCLHAEATTHIRFTFSSSLSTCRLRHWDKKQMLSSSSFSLRESMEIKSATTYLLDCFQK